MARTKSKEMTMYAFIQEYLLENPRITTQEIRDAWTMMGRKEPISAALIGAAKTELRQMNLLPPAKATETEPPIGINRSVDAAKVGPKKMTRLVDEVFLDSDLANIEIVVDELIYLVHRIRDQYPGFDGSRILEPLRGVRRAIILMCEEMK